MFNTKICIISSLIMIILTAIMSSISYYSSLKLEHTMMGQLFHLLFVILNVIIYFIYLNSNMNKLVGYFGALLTAIVCYIIQAFFYHFNTNFKYWGPGLGTELGTSLFIIFHIVIGLICGVIYFIMLVRNQK